MPLLNNLNPEGERIQNRVNLILYADYLTAMTQYENGLIPNPPTFKGDVSFFLRVKQGRIDTSPSFQNFLILSSTPSPTPPSSSSISIPQAGSTFITVNWPPSARATSYSYTLNGVPYTPAIDNGLSGSITLDNLSPGTQYTLVITATGPSGTSTSGPLSIYTTPVAPLAASFVPSAQTQTGFTIGWSGGAGITGYSYRIFNTEPRELTAADGVVIIDNGLSRNSVSFEGLSTGTQYSVIVTAQNPSGSQSSLPYTIFTGPSQPPPPTPSAPSLNGFTIPYPSSGGAASYTYAINGVQIAAAPAVPGFTRSGNTIIFSGLTPGVPQDLVITAIGFTGTTSSSAVTRIYTTPVSLPSSSIAKSSSSPSEITLAWPTANSGATSYTYTVLDSLGNPVPGVGVVGDGVTGNTVSFTGLSPGVPYTITVNAINPSQAAAVPSASFVVYTAPAAATTLVQSRINTTQTSSTISWGGATGASGYTYVVRDASGRTLTLGTDYTLINNGMVNSSATFGGLTPGNTYSVIVVATDTFGQTSSTPIPIITTPSTPTAIIQTDATQTSFTVSWSGGLGATSYSYTLNTLDATPAIDNGLTSKTATFTGLNPGDSKDLIITATNSMGDSPSARVSQYALTGPPTSLYSSAITSGGFTVNWLAPTGASSYTYTITDSSGTTVATDSTHLSTSGANYATFARLSPLTLYNVIVNADNPAPGVTPSTVIQITTGPGPSRPTGSAVSGSTTSAGFSVTLGGGTGGTGTSTYTFTYTDASGVRRSITPTSVVGDVATFSGLPPGGSYVLHVVATDSVGTPSPALDFPFTTAAGPAQPALSTTPTTVPCGTVTGGSGSVTSPAVPGGNLAYTYTLTDSSTTPPTITTVSVGSPSGGISVTESGTPPVATFAGLVPGRSYTTSATGSVSCGTATSTASSVTPPPIPGAITPYIYTLVDTSVTPNTTITVSAGSPSGGISVVEVGTPPVATFTGLVAGHIYTVNAAGSVSGGTTSSASPSVSVPHTYTLVDSSTTPPTTITVAPGRPSGGISVTETGTPPVATFTGLVPGGSYAVSTPSSVSCGTATSGSPSVTAPSIPGGTQPYTYTLVDSSTTPPTTRTVSVGNPSGGISVTESGTPPVATFAGLVSGRSYSVSATTSVSCGTATSVSSSVNVPEIPTVTAPASTSVTVSSISAPPPYTYTLTDTSTTPPTITVVTTLTSPVDGISVTESGTPPVATFTGLVNGRSYSVSATGSPLPSAGITSQGFSLATPPATSGTLPLSYSYTLVNTSTTPHTTTLVTAANSPQNGITVIESGTPPVARFTGLAPGAAYTVSVSTRDAAGTNSPTSAPVSFSTLPGPVVPVQGTVSGLTPFSATVPFTTPGSGSTPASYSYTLVANGVTTTVSVANSPQNGISVTETVGPPRAAVFTGLAANTAYSVTVNSIDRYGSSTSSASFSITTPPSTPTNPTSLAFPTIGNTTALVTWSGGEYATSYSFVVTNTTSGAVVNPTIVTYLMNGSLAPNSATISGLLAGFSYSVTVQAVNSFASSSVSTVGSFTTTVLVTTFATGLLGPTAITSDGTNFYVAQAPSTLSQNTTDNIMRIDSGGNVTPIVSGSAKATTFSGSNVSVQGGVFGICYSPVRSPPLIFTDHGNHVIKACETDGSSVTTILGTSGSTGSTNGTGAAARFYRPSACASDSSGNLYIGDTQNSTTRLATLANVTSTIGAFGSGASYIPDIVNDIIWVMRSELWKQKLSSPYTAQQYYYKSSTGTYMNGITMDMYGNIIMADNTKNNIRLIYTYGRSIIYNGVTLIASLVTNGTNADTANNNIIYAGSGVSGFSNDTLLNSTFNIPWGVQLSADNTTLYVTERGNGAVRSMPYVIHTILSSLLPTEPTSVALIAGVINEFTIGWSKVFDATSYTYLIKDSSNNTVYPGIATLVTESVANQKASFSGLVYGQTYTVTVTAVNVNGSTPSTATSITYQPFTYLFASGLNNGYSKTIYGYTGTSTNGLRLTGITVDSNNNVYLGISYYITNTQNMYSYIYYPIIQFVSFTPSGTKTIYPIQGQGSSSNQSAFYNNYNVLYSLSVQNKFLVNNVFTNKIQAYESDFSSISTVGNSLQMCGYNNILGYFYVFTGTIINVYNASNTLIGPISTLPKSTTDLTSNLATNLYTGTMTVDPNNNVWVLGENVINSVSTTKTLPCLRQFTPNGNIGYTYTDTTGGSGTATVLINVGSILSDSYGNIIIITNLKIYILYMSTLPFLYNGTNYTYGQIIPYAGSGVNGTSYTASRLTSYNPGIFTHATLDITGSILYVTDNNYSSIISFPYIIRNLPPTPLTDIIITSGTPSTLIIQWQGGISATSYSYTFTDSSGNPISINISTDNGLTLQKIILSGNFPIGFSFNLAITATNAYGNYTKNQEITVTGFVSTFATGFSSPAAITFDNNNLLYLSQAVAPTATYPNVISIASNGTTKTTIVSTFAGSPFGLAYNATLGLLMLTDSGNGRLWTSTLSPNTQVQRITGISGVRGCVVDSYGNTYVINTTTGNVLKFSTTYVQTTAILQTTAVFNAPHAITIDPLGNLWVTDTGNNSIKKFSNSGALLETYTGFSTPFSTPRGITSDKFGNIIVSDTGNNLIKIIYTYPATNTIAGITYTAVTSGLCNIYTYAGIGTAGSINSRLLASSFTAPWGLQLDNTGDVLYVADSANGVAGNGVIRSMPYTLNTLPPLPITPTKPLNLTSSVISPIAIKISWSGVYRASSYSYSITDSNSNSVSYTTVSDNALSGQNITFIMNSAYSSYNFTITATNGELSTSSDIFTVTVSSGVTTFAGSGTAGNTNGIGTAASLNGPSGGCIDPATGDIYVSNFNSHCISKITPSGVVSVFAGTPGTPTQRASSPKGLAIYDGYLYCCNLNFISKISLADTSYIQLLIGFNPSYIVSNGTGNFYTNNSLSSIYVGDSLGNYSLYANFTTAVADKINGIALDTDGNLYISQNRSGAGAGIISKIDTSKNVTNILTSITSPIGLKFSSDYSVLYLGSSGDNIIRKYTIATSTWSTVAGSSSGYLDSTTLTSARFSSPNDIIVHPDNTFLYVMDTGNNRIRMVIL